MILLGKQRNQAINSSSLAIVLIIIDFGKIATNNTGAITTIGSQRNFHVNETAMVKKVAAYPSKARRYVKNKPTRDCLGLDDFFI